MLCSTVSCKSEKENERRGSWLHRWMRASTAGYIFSADKLRAGKLIHLNLIKNGKQGEAEMSHSMADKEIKIIRCIIRILYDNCVFKQSPCAQEYRKHDKSGWRWRLLLIPFSHLKENELCGGIGGVPLKSERRRRARNPATERLRTL